MNGDLEERLARYLKWGPGRRVAGSSGRGGFLFSGVRAVRPPGRWVRTAAGPLGRRVGSPGSSGQSDNDKSGGVRGSRREAQEGGGLVSTRGKRPTSCPGALTVRLASVTWDNALGDFDVGADVGEHGQNFGLTTLVFEETKR